MNKPRFSPALIIRSIAIVAIVLAAAIALLGLIGSSEPVRVSIHSCEGNRVEVTIVNPTDHHVQINAWVTSGNQLQSTATGEAGPHSTGSGFGGFSGVAIGACNITSLDAFATERDGNDLIPNIIG